jgi:hypothetical protein
LDFFRFVDIADIIVEGTKTVTIVTRRNTRIIMSSPQAASIKLFIERFLSGKPKVIFTIQRTKTQKMLKIRIKMPPIDSARRAIQNEYHIMGFWGFDPWPSG